MTGVSLFRSSIALLVLAFLAGCAEVPVTPATTTPAVAPTPPPGYWADDGLPGAPKIIVSISEQRAYFFKGKRLIGESTVSTGKAGFSTPPGNHRVVWKNIDHISTRFGDYVDGLGNVVKSNVDSRKDSRPPGSHFQGAPMPFAMFFRGGYAMHQGYVPPYAASHGCIRLPRGMAEVFFNAAPYGTPVIVKQEPFMRRVTAPAPGPMAPGPVLVPSSISPAPVRPSYVRSTVPAPATVRPTPLPVLSPSPAPIRPTHLRSTVAPPATVRPPVPTPAPVRRTSVRSTVPAPVTVRPPAPAPLRSPSPAPIRPTSPRLTAPPPTHVRSPAAVRSTAPASVRPTPIPALSPAPGPSRSRVPVRRPAPSPTPTPARR